MKIVVTGSIAYDYLMSFPGKFTEQILPEHLHRLSVSFLVDSMDKRRGGCAPNIAYTLALVTDYDCWHPDHDSVTVDLIVANLLQNARTAQQAIAEAVGRIDAARTCGCKDALATAIITRPELVPEQTKRELEPIIGKYMK